MHMPNRLALLLLVSLSLAAQADERPNFLVIMVDDMGYSDPGCYGGEIDTPNIDGLAADGLRFGRFYNCARCCPTRATLLTGAYAHRVGLARNGSTLSSEVPTIAERLKSAGYETAMTGKWHLSRLAEAPQGDERIRWMNHEIARPKWPFADPSSYPTRRGFDRYYGVIWGVVDFFDPFSLTESDRPVTSVPDDYYVTDAITDHTMQNLRDFAKTGEPFFHYVAYTAPHWPLHARPEDIAKYKGKYDAGGHALRRSRFARQMKLGLFPRDMPLGDVIERKEVWSDLDADARAYQAAKMEVHAAMVDRVDRGIGRIVRTLRETAQLDSTVIFFLADNGASPEIPGRPGYDRNGTTRDGRPALREAELQKPENRAKLGSAESYTGIGPAWANAVNTPLRYWKKESYEGGNRTPLIVHWPAGLRAEAGSIERSLGHVMDIAPTCLNLAGVEPNGGFAMDGKSLKPLLEGKPRDAHKSLFFEHEGGRAVRRDGWKLSAMKGQPWELFHIVEDPGETNNLADKHADRVQTLAAAWQDWYDTMPVPESARIKPGRGASLRGPTP